MRIKGIHIDGFGVHKDCSIRNLSPNLNIIYGKNEDGKTTLRDFVNTIFFGFKQRNDVRRHEPINGGKHGGSITLTAKDGEITVARNLIGNKSNTQALITSMKESENEISLDMLLNGINEGVYENIFSFGLDELSKLSSLTNKEVMDYIYTAGIGLNDSSLKGIRKELRGEMDEIWKKRSNKGLNQELELLKEITSEKLEIKAQGELYIDLLEKLEKLNAERETLEKNKKDVLERVLELQHLSKGLPIYQEILLIDKEIKENSFEGTFNREDKGEFINLINRLDETVFEITAIDEELANTKRQVNEITVNEQILDFENQIYELYKNIPLHKQSRKFYEDGCNRLEKIEAAIDIGIKKLDGIIVKDITTINIPLGVVEQLQESQEIYNDKKGEIDFLTRELENLSMELTELEAEKQLLTQENSVEILNILLGAKEEFAKKAKGNNILFILILILTSIVLVGWMEYPRWLMIILAAAAIPLVGIYILVSYLIPKRHRKEVQKLLRKYGITHVNTANIDFLIRKLEQEEILKKNVLKEMGKINNRRDEKEKLTVKLEGFLSELIYEKEVILQNIGLSKKLTQPLAISAIKLIAEVKELIAEKDKLKVEVDTYASKEREFIEECIRVSEKLTYKVSNKEFGHIATILDFFAKELEEQKNNSLKLSQFKEEYKKIERKKEALVHRKEDLERKINLFLEKGKVKTKEQYLQRYASYERSLELTRRKDNLTSKLEAMLPSLELTKKIQDATKTELEYWLKEFEDKYSEISAAIEANNVERGKLSKEIETMENAGSLEELVFQETIIRDKIKNGVIKWTTNKIALMMLDVTIKEYEDRYQPGVFKRAEKYFGYMTEGRYKRVKIKGESKEIVVLDPKGREINSQLLSRGTQEQLYICVRLGLIEEFCEKNGNLPVLFDDVFVNFDDDRSQRGIETLLEFSKENQVLFFTCHKRIVDILEKKGNNTINIIKLG